MRKMEETVGAWNACSDRSAPDFVGSINPPALPVIDGLDISVEEAEKAIAQAKAAKEGM